MLGRFSAQEKEAMERAAKEYAAGCDLPTDDLSWLVGVRKGMIYCWHPKCATALRSSHGALKLAGSPGTVTRPQHHQ